MEDFLKALKLKYADDKKTKTKKNMQMVEIHLGWVRVYMFVFQMRPGLGHFSLLSYRAILLECRLKQV